jgi:protein gp37
MPTKIEWANEVWNPVVGCTPASAGCDHCYARAMFNRNLVIHTHKFENPSTYPNRLDIPFHWKNPRRVFVNSMSDLFHPDVPFDFVAKVWAVMTNPKNSHHTFMVLTKRPERLLEFSKKYFYVGFTEKNVFIGVTAENQETADERIPVLLQVPAAIRFVSVEPMLGPVKVTNFLMHDFKPGDPQFGWELQCSVIAPDGLRHCGYPPEKHPMQGIDWIICGGESGPGARFMHPDWVRKLRDQCIANHVPFFFKGWAGFKYESTNAVLVFKDTHEPVPDDAQPLTRKFIGKKRAGRMLDGREWNQFPEVK